METLNSQRLDKSSTTIMMLLKENGYTGMNK
jgi:hypothetical protein